VTQRAVTYQGTWVNTQRSDKNEIMSSGKSNSGGRCDRNGLNADSFRTLCIHFLRIYAVGTRPFEMRLNTDYSAINRHAAFKFTPLWRCPYSAGASDSSSPIIPFGISKQVQNTRVDKKKQTGMRKPLPQVTSLDPCSISQPAHTV